MPKKIVAHDHEEEIIEGFLWDGIRLTEFAGFFGGNFCFIGDNHNLVIDSTVVNIGDWVVKEDGGYTIVSSDEFAQEFDIV